MDLKERVNKFLKELGVPTTVFCRKMNFSISSMRDWRAGKFNFSEQREKEIDEYLSRYGF